MLHSKSSRENSPQEAVKAAIEYTISQDLAAGHTAEQARRLRGFHGDDTSNLIQLSQTTAGNHQLQDYQMQLMLLEQQNKKRLMMARQEQAEDEELAQSGAEHLQLSRKRQKLDATANDMDGNLTFTSPIMEQVMSGLDQASNYDVRSLDKISLQETDVCRHSPAISEFSIRSIAQAKIKTHTIR